LSTARQDNPGTRRSGAGTSLGPGLESYLDEGERVLLDTRPSPLFVVLWPAGTIVVVALVGAGLAWGATRVGAGAAGAILGWAAALALVRVGWQVLDWLMRRYVLTDRRVLAMRGVLRRHIVDMPLARVQHVSQYRSLRERLFGLGSIGFATAGTGATEVFWLMVRAPHDVLRRVRAAIEPWRDSAEPRVIGLAGGVGAGKSTVARMLGELGCVVSDSDAHARAALDRPEVRDRLVDWWGEEVVGADGRVDRRRVARIVFEDPEARKKLESVVHPLVHEGRMEDMERARAIGAPALVIDAPLLLEAGVDRECDAVIFVDAPEAVRRERVRRERGWDASELERREKAQIPMEQKRRRADYTVENAGDLAPLAREVEEVLRRIVGPAKPSRGEGRAKRTARD